MFADLDETIRQLLIKGVPLDLSEVDISFDAPDREWSGRLSRPTINCFLYDVRENLDLRATDFEQLNATTKNGKAATAAKRLPARIDATYQITIWARAPEDEHHLLWRVLAVLYRTPVIPDELLQGGLKNQIYPTPARVAQPNQARANPAELWQSIDNRIRPALSYTVTLPLDPEILYPPYEPVERRSARLFAQHPVEPGVEGLQFNGRTVKREEGARIKGRLVSRTDPKKGVASAKVTVRESAAISVTDDEGRFELLALTGKSHLTIVLPDGTSVSQVIDVPSPDYNLQV